MDRLEIQKYVDTYAWYLFEQIPQCPLWFCLSPLSAYVRRLDESYGVGRFRGFYIFQNGDLYMFKMAGELEHAGEVLIERDVQEKGFLLSVLLEIEQLSNELTRGSRALQDMDIDNTENKKLADVFQQVFEIHEDLWVKGQAINLLEHGYSLLGKMLMKLLRQDGVPEKHVIEISAVLTTPERYSNLQKEEQDLLSLVEQGATEDRITQHWKKWAWLGYNWLGPAYEREHFVTRAQLLEKDEIRKGLIKTEERYREDVRARKQKVTTDFRLSNETMRIAILIEEIIFCKAVRVDASWLFYWSVEGLFKKIAEEYGLSYIQVQFLKPDEIIAALNGECVDADILRKRKRSYAILFRDGIIEEYFDEIATLIFTTIGKTLSVDSSKMQELRGDVGSPGIANGIVKIVNMPGDISKMQEGNILVSHTTNPSLVPAMKMAGAIVADVGGVTSHAAIVARELKKPCIIGTKIATKVLKDGDEVEVDAEKGVVRILKRAS